MTERRKQQRSRALKTATLVFNNRSSTISCTVRNLSARGAKLIVGTQIGIPQMFDLRFPGDRSGRACKVIWRREGELGIEFA